MSTFSGFPKESFKFLDDLAKNNSKDWFDANKSTYQKKLQEPALDLIVALGERLQKLSKSITFSTKLNGGSLKRLNRDLRFSKDKTPYKTNLMFEIWDGPVRKESRSSFYMNIEAGNTGIGVGHFMFESDFLDVYRKAVLDNKQGGALQEIVDGLVKDGYGQGGEALKGVPRGFDKEHPRAELLKYKGMYVHSPSISKSDMISKDCLDICFAHCERMFPYHQWLMKQAKKL